MKLRHQDSLRDHVEAFYRTANARPGDHYTVHREVSPVSEFQLTVTEDVRVSFRAAALPGPDGPEIVIGDLRADVDPRLRFFAREPTPLARVMEADARRREAETRAASARWGAERQAEGVSRWVADLKSRKRGVRRRAKRKLAEIGGL